MFKWIKFGVEIVAIFIFIKFLLFPIVGYFLGTSAPLVAVVSGSMEHNGNFTTWWGSQKTFYEAHNISKAEFNFSPFRNGFNTGSVMLLMSSDNIQIGDVIVYKANDNYIIHRVVSLNPLQTKGDANEAQIPNFELDIDKKLLVGKAVANVPYLGWVKTIFIKIVEKVT